MYIKFNTWLLVAASQMLVLNVALSQEQQEQSPIFTLNKGDHKELLDMFNADQQIRHSINAENMREKLKEMSELDKRHKPRLLEITKSGQLKTKYDYFRASVMFQHQTGGSQVALELALASMKLGCPEAPGMVARAYDRFLFEDLGRGQRFGTQRGPDRKLRPLDNGNVPVTDTLRKIMDIPPLAEDDQ